eukprot:10272025-Ditylum_brightwellii.AAC.1
MSEKNKLWKLNLEGNMIQDTNNLLYLKILKHVRFVTFQKRRQEKDDKKESLSSNPVCNDKDYDPILSMVLPDVEMIDGESTAIREAAGLDDKRKEHIDEDLYVVENLQSGQILLKSLAAEMETFEEEIHSRVKKTFDSINPLTQSRKRFDSAMIDALDALRQC